MTLVYESKGTDDTTEICILKFGGDKWLNDDEQLELVKWITKNRASLLRKCGWVLRNPGIDEALNMGDGSYKP